MLVTEEDAASVMDVLCWLPSVYTGLYVITGGGGGAN
jgi:hypothetical protein